MSKINSENKAIWETNANCWDAKMGAEGNDWHQKLISPFTIELLGLSPHSNLLDIGCGNGVFARTMAAKDINVTAFDFSENNIKNARKYNCNMQANQKHINVCEEEVYKTLFFKYSKEVSSSI